MATAGIAELELRTGDHLTQQEFHQLYARTAKNFRAELIGGVVYVSSPLGLSHGKNHMPLASLFFHYSSLTPGVESADNATVILSGDGETQPDILMRVLPEFGGQSRTTEDEYIEGAPELLSEIAVSSRAIDLHEKKDAFAQAGVLEYLVLCVRERTLRWFDLRESKELSPDSDGVIRVRCFPGFWIDVEAVLNRDSSRMLETLEKGLASAEHAEFVRQLAARKT